QLQAALADATAGGPLGAARLAPFVADVQAARTAPPLTPGSIAGTPAAPIVQSLLWERPGGGWATLLPLHTRADAVDVDAVQAVMHGLEGVQVVQIGAELRRLYRHFLDEALTQALTGATGVVLLMAIWLRSARRLAAVCLPLLLAVLLTVAGLRIAQVPLGILHLVGLLLVVAVGSNYALFFDLLTEADTPPHPDTLASLAIANLTTVLSFGLIAQSSIPVLAAIGRVVAPGALLALLLAAAYAPRRAPQPPLGRPGDAAAPPAPV
ncbi:MAG: transporter, partial [Rubrivivax sp.]